MGLWLLHEDSQGKMQGSWLELQTLAVTRRGHGQGREGPCQPCLAQTQQLPQGNSLDKRWEAKPAPLIGKCSVVFGFGVKKKEISTVGMRWPLLASALLQEGWEHAGKICLIEGLTKYSTFFLIKTIGIKSTQHNTKLPLAQRPIHNKESEVEVSVGPGSKGQNLKVDGMICLFRRITLWPAKTN